jgi:hypothetical protein
MSSEIVSADFLKMFDALMIIETASDARELAQNPDLMENLEFHETERDLHETEADEESEPK